jgi:hypothetical protein
MENMPRPPRTDSKKKKRKVQPPDHMNHMDKWEACIPGVLCFVAHFRTEFHLQGKCRCCNHMQSLSIQ